MRFFLKLVRSKSQFLIFLGIYLIVQVAHVVRNAPKVPHAQGAQRDHIGGF